MMGPPNLRQEAVEQAVHGRRLLDMQGIEVEARESWEAVALDAAERWAIRAEAREAASGLVSVPTSGKRWARPTVPFRVSADSAAVRQALKVVPANPRRRMLPNVNERPAVLQVLDSFCVDAQARRLANLRMNVGFAARGQLVQVPEGYKSLMVTLTYAVDSWGPRHVADFLAHVRKHLQRRGLEFRYVWVGELQRRGVIHYHVALFVPHGFSLPRPDEWFARRYHGPAQPQAGECAWWVHGWSRVETARAAIPYLLKYLSKGDSKSMNAFPKGARIYGMGGLDFQLRRARRWLGLPAFVRNSSGIMDHWSRAEGGGWNAPEGTHYPAEFRRVVVGHMSALIRTHRHPTAWPSGAEPSGPFMWLTDRAAALACETTRGLQ